MAFITENETNTPSPDKRGNQRGKVDKICLRLAIRAFASEMTTIFLCLLLS